MEHKIRKIDVYLVSTPVTSGFADATRKVESVGFTVVCITTDQGLEGIGLTYHEVGGEATKALIEYNIAPKLIGRNPLETEVIWQDMVLYLRGVGRKGLTFCALSAIDIALWDLKGKIVNLPLFRLLGGNKTCLPVYGSGGWTSYSDEQYVAEAQEMVKRGYTNIKIKVGVDGGKNPKRDLLRVQKVRDAIGQDIGIMLDANNCWDAATGARFANQVKELDIIFLEEPVFADDIPGLIKYKQSTDLPLASGEHEYTKYGARDLIMSGAVDIIQVDGARAGGYTEMLKISAITQAWNLKFAPHAMELIHSHLASASPNIFMLERLLLFEDVTSKTFKNAQMPKDGYLTVPSGPGLGLEIDMDFIMEYVQK
jgi:L-alanine-DL-glutamate epimerase-like enolase superfamily enzyme